MRSGRRRVDAVDLDQLGEAHTALSPGVKQRGQTRPSGDLLPHAAGHLRPILGDGLRISDVGVPIAVDVGFASDSPGSDPKVIGEASLGKGPSRHRGPNINPGLGNLLVSTARKKKIPYQMQAEPGPTGTDANAMQMTRSGVAAALVSIPNRYMHTPVEVISLTDLDNASKLIAEAIAALSGRNNFIPKAKRPRRK